MNSWAENCAVQATVGEGNQGSWRTCAVYAVCGVLRQLVLRRYGIDLEDTSNMASRIIGMNLRNEDGHDVLSHGIGIESFVKELNKMMIERQNLLFFERTESGAPGKAIRFGIKCHQLDWQRPWESVFRNPSETPSETPSGFRAYCDCSNWVVHASGPGTHRHHAMQCLQVLLDFPLEGFGVARLLCSNSWGENERNRTVPDHILFPRIVAIWVLSVYGIERRDAGSPWASVLPLREDPLTRRMHVPHVPFALTDLEVMQCDCGIRFGCSRTEHRLWHRHRHFFGDSIVFPEAEHPMQADHTFAFTIPWCPKCNDEELFRVHFLSMTERQWPTMLTPQALSDQGSWSTCAVYAVCGVLRQLVLRRYGIDLEDTSNMAEQIIRMNFQDGYGHDILSHGIDFPTLISKLSEMMIETQNLWFFERTQGQVQGRQPHGPLVRFGIECHQLDWQRPWESVFRNPSETPSGFRAYCDCSNWVVHASRPGTRGPGTHGHHAMQCLQLLLDFQPQSDPVAHLLCSNSWGETERNMTVPNHNFYTRIEAIWELSVYGVERRDPGSAWASVPHLREDPFTRVMHVPHVPFALTDLEVLQCDCGICFGCSRTEHRHFFDLIDFPEAYPEQADPTRAFRIPWCPKCNRRQAIRFRDLVERQWPSVPIHR